MPLYTTETATSSSRREPPASGGGCSRRSDCLQVGQEERESNQVSMHLTWKPWLHFGKTLTFSPSTKSPRQIKHSVAFMLMIPDPYNPSGICFNALFLRPVVAAKRPEFAFAFEASATWSSEVNLLVMRSTQRKAELRLRAQIKAQSKAAKMMTMLVSK